jgi:acyl-CoA synthetase (AMP-forming)/AMP-acid ligase II
MGASTLFHSMADVWDRYPTRTAFVYHNKNTTYSELRDAALRLAAAYRAIGIGPGDRILCSMSNRPEQFVVMLAGWACGAVHVGVDHELTAHEIREIILLVRPKLVVYESIDGEHARDVAKSCFGIRLIAVGHDQDAPEGSLSMTDLLRDHGDRRATDVQACIARPQDPAFIFVTSGTTGRPKAAIGFHANLAERWRRLGAWLEFSPEDCHLAHLPLSHGFGLMMSVAAMLAGGKLVLMRSYTGREAVCAIQRERVTVFNGAPAHFSLLLSALSGDTEKCRSLRLSVGTAAFFSRELVQVIWAQLNVRFMFMYGSSEGVGVATTDREDIIRGSVGRPAPGAVAIVGDDRQLLPCGELGEIAFSRKIYPVRHWSVDCDSSLQPAEEEWYYSGDLGRIDSEGRLYVLGRKKHQIDRGGLKVDPVEVEAGLLSCADIVDAAVLGVHNPVLGESVCACVVSTAATPPTLEDIREALRARLAPFKLPERLCLLAAIPRTRVGKVDLKRLEMLIAAAEGQTVSYI